MDSGSEVPRRSKRRFQPRPPKPSPKPIPPISNSYEAEADEEEIRKTAQRIARRIGIGQRKSKTETKVQVTFQPSFSSLAIKPFGVPKEDDGSDVNITSATTAVTLSSESSAAIVPCVSSSTNAQKDVEEEVRSMATRVKENYVEPWDFRNSYYPTVLPLRKPYSGDPELRDKEEFGDKAKHDDYDENKINSAKELGLTSKKHCKKQMFFFKMPDCLPITKQVTEATNKGSDDSAKRSNPFEGLQEGYMGKMLVYKSGAVKLKLGDVLYDVSPGPNANFHNDVTAIDIKGRKCCRIGSSAKFVTVTPDVESLLNSASDK